MLSSASQMGARVNKAVQRQSEHGWYPTANPFQSKLIKMQEVFRFCGLLWALSSRYVALLAKPSPLVDDDSLEAYRRNRYSDLSRLGFLAGQLRWIAIRLRSD
jgi:hypothetical protein